MGPAFSWPQVLGSVVLFTALHWCMQRFVDSDFHNALKLSRGIAAVLLTLLGIAALVDALEHWPTAFVYRHDHADWMRVALLWVYGHFISDFLWMFWGRWAHASPIRWDLVVHHLLGIVAFSIALALQAGYALGLIVMITEVLPVSTGLKGLGIALDKPRLTALADRAHLNLLIWVRLPLWATLLALSVRVLLVGNANDLLPAYRVVTGGLVLLMALDVFWIWEYVSRRNAK